MRRAITGFEWPSCRNEYCSGSPHHQLCDTGNRRSESLPRSSGRWCCYPLTPSHRAAGRTMELTNADPAETRRCRSRASLGSAYDNCNSEDVRKPCHQRNFGWHHSNLVSRVYFSVLSRCPVVISRESLSPAVQCGTIARYSGAPAAESIAWRLGYSTRKTSSHSSPGGAITDA